jgi:hypothetical protein
LTATSFACRSCSSSADLDVRTVVERACKLRTLLAILAAPPARRGTTHPFTPMAMTEQEGGRPFACMVEPPSLDTRIVASSIRRYYA